MVDTRFLTRFSASKLRMPAILLGSVLLGACNKDVTTFNKIYFKMAFAEDQARLDNFGNPVTIPAGHAAQTPDMQKMSVHYIEVLQDSLVQLGDGVILYQSPETSEGGERAIDFAASAISEEGTQFASMQIERLPAGTYTYIRASVAYQQYGVLFDLHNVPVLGTLNDQTGLIGSFVGYNTYIETLTLDQLSVDIHANKAQGFWAFETQLTDAAAPYNAIYTGQAPAGATTVVNPLHATSPIPEGSCVITGRFDPPLVVEEGETRDLEITLSFSLNQSFEWIESTTNGKWDIDATDPESSESVVDMGVRGLIPIWTWKE